MSTSAFPTTRLFELDFFAGSKQEFLTQVAHYSDKKDHSMPLVVFTPNAEQVVQSQADPQFLRDLQSADVLLPDGVGVVMASRVFARLGKAQAISERVTGIDVVTELLRRVPLTEHILLVGGQDLSTSSDLECQGRTLTWLAGYADVVHPTEVEEQAVRSLIEELQPSILLVAFGAPNQEKWVVSHRDFLAKNHVAVAMVIGGTFDVLLGKLQRAPVVWQKLGLEWLFRLLQEPWRWKRQLRLVQFLGLIVRKLFQ